MNECEAIKNQALELLGRRRQRLTPTDLERELRRSNPAFQRKNVRSAIKDLVAQGELIYTHHFNTTHLEINFQRPVRVSRRITLSPSDCILPGKSGELVIKLHQSDAFGMGDHPTTRLSLMAVDIMMDDIMAKGYPDEVTALDIGTGSGVLAIAAVGLGADNALGIDHDATALQSAADNILLNDMSKRIVLSKEPLECLAKNKFNLIMANLRPPTVKQMLPEIENLSTPVAYWVISGCREEAISNSIGMLPKGRTDVIWQAKTGGWAAFAVKYRWSHADL